MTTDPTTTDPVHTGCQDCWRYGQAIAQALGLSTRQVIATPLPALRNDGHRRPPVTSTGCWWSAPRSGCRCSAAGCGSGCSVARERDAGRAARPPTSARFL